MVGAKEVGSRPSPAHIAAMLEAQMKMQQKFTEFNKRSAEEMNALRHENARLRRKVEAEGVTNKGKDKKNPENARSMQKVASHLRVVYVHY